MYKSTFLTLSVLLSAAPLGCDGTLPSEPVVEDGRSLQNYTRQPNGTGIHIGSTQPESWFGLAGTSLTWFMDGFNRRPDGSWVARGWYSLDIGLISAEAPVLAVEYAGSSLSLSDIRTVGSRLQLDVRSGGETTTLQDAALSGATLVLRVPDLTGLLSSTYRLRIGSQQLVDGQTGDVYAYGVDYRQAGLLGSSWSSYCRGPGGEAQRALFYQGAQWNPLDGSRSDGSDRITMTCETGSVAKCMRWGYRPWASATTQQGDTRSLVDHHQACVHMKRASYCGDRRSNTIDGTWIYIQDQLSPSLHSGPLDSLEALWTTDGAACLSQRRRPELLFLGCASPLPTCTAAQQSSYLLATAIASPGSLLGLTD
jgi:hypothetical protein